jgi:hypothetical protein
MSLSLVPILSQINQSITPHPILLRSIFILFFNICLHFANGLFPFRLSHQNPIGLLPHVIHTVPFDLLILIVFGEESKLRSSCNEAAISIQSRNKMAVNEMEINSLFKIKKATISISEIKSVLIVLFRVKGLNFCHNTEK